MRAHALPQQWVSYVTELEHIRCAHMHYPKTKGIICNRTIAYKMRAHALPQASCVHAVNERIKEKTCYAHTPTPSHTHTISYNNERKQRLAHIFHFLSLI